MKIYTYYQDVGFNNSAELDLIKIWKQSWSNQGYEPVVLTQSNVENHYFYNELDSNSIDFKKNIQVFERGINTLSGNCFNANTFVIK